jgi:hypothetical protein
MQQDSGGSIDVSRAALVGASSDITGVSMPLKLERTNSPFRSEETRSNKG